MAYRKFNIYDGVRISDKVLSAGVVAGILAIVLLMVIGSIRGFTVDFQTGGGEIVAEQHLRYGEKVKEPETPSREGYVFDGWYSDSARTRKIDFSKLYAKDDITLYAAWNRADTAVNSEIKDKQENIQNEIKEFN